MRRIDSHSLDATQKHLSITNNGWEGDDDGDDDDDGINNNAVDLFLHTLHENIDVKVSKHMHSAMSAETMQTRENVLQ